MVSLNIATQNYSFVDGNIITYNTLVNNKAKLKRVYDINQYQNIYYAWSSEILEKQDTSNIEYQLSSIIEDDKYKLKEEEWFKLVGKENFLSLDKEPRDFLIKTAGIIDLGHPFDIKETFNYSIYNNED